MMKAARIHGYGAEPVMDDVPVPEAGPNQVLVRLKAASLNPLDVKLHSGVTAILNAPARHGFTWRSGSRCRGAVSSRSGSA